MAIPAYTQGYPNVGQTLGNTRDIIRNNLDGTFLTLAVDHVNNNGTNPGYHTVVHLQPKSQPMAKSGIAQAWGQSTDDQIATDVLLKYMNGSGNLYQFTRNFNPFATAGNATEGTAPLPPTNWSAVIPGTGLIVQGGTVLITPNQTITINLVQNLPFALYTILGAVSSSGSTSNNYNWLITKGSFAQPNPNGPYTSFQVRFAGGFSNSNNDIFCWMAIGN